MPIESDGKIYLTQTELKPIFAGKGLVDGTRGGLLLGNNHSEGGVLVIRKAHKEDLFEIIAELEGWQFIINPLAT